MRALSVRQPYAELIARGEKTIEYRSWGIAHRGDLLIVASKVPHEDHPWSPRDVARLPFGVAICVVELHDVDGEDGEFDWHLRDPRRVEAVPLRGYAAIYNVPDDLIRIVAPPVVVAAPRAKVPRRATRPAMR